MPSSVRKHVPQPTWKTGFARSASESAHPELWDGLVGAWNPGLGPTGDNLFDVSGNSNNGTLVDMAPASDWVVEKGRYSLDFDGTNDFVNIGDVLNPGTGDFTICMWVNPGDEAGTAAIFSKRAAAGGSEVGFGIGTRAATNAIQIHSNPTGGDDTGVDAAGLYDGEMHLMSIVFQRNNAVEYYQDGVLKDTTSYSLGAGDITNTVPLKIASYGSSPTVAVLPLTAKISEVYYFDRAIIPAKIKKLWNLGRGGIFEPNQVEYYLAPSAALDQTRMSTFNIGMPWRSGSMVNPLDTGFTAANRQASGFMYAGIIAQAPGGATLPPLLEGNMLIGGFQNMSGGL